MPSTRPGYGATTSDTRFVTGSVTVPRRAPCSTTRTQTNVAHQHAALVHANPARLEEHRCHLFRPKPARIHRKRTHGVLDGCHTVADFAVLYAKRLARFERYRGNAGVGCGPAQSADGAAVVQDHGRSEAARQFDHVEVRQIAAHLREVRAVKRAGVDVDQIVAGFDDVFEQRVGQPRGRAALFLTGEVAIQIAPVGQVTRATAEAVEVHDRHADNGATEVRGIYVVEHAPDDLETIVFVAVHYRSETQRRSQPRSVGNQHAARNRITVERHAGRPIQHVGGTGSDDLAEDRQRLRFAGRATRQRGWIDRERQRVGRTGFGHDRNLTRRLGSGGAQRATSDRDRSDGTPKNTGNGRLHRSARQQKQTGEPRTSA